MGLTRTMAHVSTVLTLKLDFSPWK